MGQESGVGAILHELFRLLAAAVRDVLLYTFVVGGVTAIGVLNGLTETTAQTFEFGFRVTASDTPASALFDLLVAVASIVGTYLLLKRYLAAAGRLHDERNRFWPYLGMAILSAFAIAFGFVLLIVPGVILLIRWSAASGYLIGAGSGVMESLASSWHATKGHSWPILFAAIVLLVGMIVAAGVLGVIAGVVGPPAGAAVSALVEAAANAILAAFGIAVYCTVHDDAREISEVFA